MIILFQCYNIECLNHTFNWYNFLFTYLNRSVALNPLVCIPNHHVLYQKQRIDCPSSYQNSQMVKERRGNGLALSVPNIEN